MGGERGGRVNGSWSARDLDEADRELFRVDETVSVGVRGVGKASKDSVSVELAFYVDAPARVKVKSGGRGLGLLAAPKGSVKRRSGGQVG